jgi:hypothetical protein
MGLPEDHPEREDAFSAMPVIVSGSLSSEGGTQNPASRLLRVVSVLIVLPFLFEGRIFSAPSVDSSSECSTAPPFEDRRTRRCWRLHRLRLL